MELLDPEDLQVKLENLAETDYRASLGLLDPRATLALAQLERKDSKASLALRVVPVALGSPALATSEHQASAVSRENLVFLGCRGSQVYLDQEAKCSLAPYAVRMETPARPVFPVDQALRVSQVSQEDLDVPGLMVPKERGEILVLEAGLDHKVFLDQEENLDFQVHLDRVLMAPGGKMVSPGVLEPKANLER